MIRIMPSSRGDPEMPNGPASRSAGAVQKRGSRATHSLPLSDPPVIERTVPAVSVPPTSDRQHYRPRVSAATGVTG